MSAMDQELSENVWFVWSKHHTSYRGDVTIRDGRTDGRTDGRGKIMLLSFWMLVG